MADEKARKRVRVIPIKFNSVDIWHNVKGRLVFAKRNLDGTQGKEMWEDEATEIVRANPRKLTILRAAVQAPKGKTAPTQRRQETPPAAQTPPTGGENPFGQTE